jgi:Cytochrome c, mono- and diheme variants
MKIGAGLTTAFLLGAVTPPSAIAQDALVEEGKVLVETYCADCHATGAEGDSPRAGAPRFRELHLRYDVEHLAEALVEGIVTHPDMPEFEFDPEQAEAIIAYMQALEGK